MKEKIKAGITKLYKNSWFNMLSVMITGLMCFVLPVVGAVIWFVYFVGWGFFAEKKGVTQ